jgi:hypothetical protein
MGTANLPNEADKVGVGKRQVGWGAALSNLSGHVMLMELARNCVYSY